MRGNLHKLGKRFKGWHQRYFEVQGSHMYYYKNATVSELSMCCRAIDFDIAIIIIVILLMYSCMYTDNY